MTDKPTYEELERRIKELEKEAVKRKETDESLYYSQEKYQNILSSIEEGYYEVDLAGNLTFFNDSLCKIYGYARDELMGMNNRDYMATETAKKAYAIFNRVYRTGEPTKIFEWEFIKKDGAKVDVEISVSLIRDSKVQAIGFRGIVRDISERKQVKRALQDSEEKFRMIFENSSDGIIVADPENMKFLYVNPAICKILGYTKEELIQMAVVDIHPKKTLEYVISEFKAQAKGEKSLAANIPFLKKNGTIIYMDTNSSIVRMGEKIRIMGVFRDVTERKHMEEVLRKSEKRYRAVVDSQTEMICRFFPDGTITFVNEAYCRYFGKSRKELVGQNFLFLIPDEDRKKVFKNIASLTQNNPVMTHEHRVANPNGEMCWHRWTNRAIFDDQNELIEFQSVGWDITDRVLAEKALKESEKRYRSLVETMNDGIGIQDENGFITYVNNKFCQMLDYKPDEFIGKPVTNFLDDHNSQILKNQTSIRRKGKVKAYEIEWTCKDGRKIQTIMSPQAIFNDNGQFKGSFSVITDISTLKQTEELLRESKKRFRNLTEITSDWIWEVDENEFYTYVSPKVRDMLGYEPEEIIGKTPFDLMPPEEADRVTKIFNNISVSQKTFDCLENLNLHKDGHPVVLETSGIPIYSADGEFLGYRGIDRNITKRKLTEELLRKQTHDLDERVKELNCLYGISKIRERPDIAFEEMLQEIVDLISSSWQYPEITCARIIIEGQEYKTKNFKETVWKQTSNIVVHGKRIGILEICYLEEKLESDEGPFLEEERSLISAIAERLGRVTEHKQTEEALRKAHDELENRVIERTRELKIEKSNLEEANIALQVLLDKRREDKKEIADNVLTNVKELVTPYFEKIKKTKLNDQQKALLNIIGYNIDEIVSPFTRKMSQQYLNLTPTEIEVANLIRYGSDSKEIADLLSLSPRTIYNHRKNIRKKFGLDNKKTNLRSHLLSIY